MQQEELQQIQKWCQQSEDAILFYAPDGTLLWQNDAAAVRRIAGYSGADPQSAG